ncbi:hypothetical protein ABTY53_32795 [Streptomyces noursei]|uniref:hypothetical protein n=1 Tax=Streptomyces noursei TaxID=1971 RepID=UPI00332D45F9
MIELGAPPGSLSRASSPERAAAHPREPEALLLAAHVLTRPAPWHDIEVRAHARALLLAAEALPAPDRPPPRNANAGGGR